MLVAYDGVGARHLVYDLEGDMVLACSGCKPSVEALGYVAEKEVLVLELETVGPHLLPHEVVVEDVAHARAALADGLTDLREALPVLRVHGRHAEGDGVQGDARLMEDVTHDVPFHSLVLKNFLQPRELLLEGGVDVEGGSDQPALGDHVAVPVELDLRGQRHEPGPPEEVHYGEQAPRHGVEHAQVRHRHPLVLRRGLDGPEHLVLAGDVAREQP
mmetsp:Transcript_20988/g.42268  ORF Transcript_20988/g.42268 Transcript_20988/m.42268 type:complete len:216 (-) Transcript_20988:613-1260(-)